MHICLICQTEFKNRGCLGAHIRFFHKIKSKQYYDQYIKKDGEGICVICGKETGYVDNGYHKHCSTKCVNVDKELIKKWKDSYREKTGYDNPSQNPEVKQKKIDTCRKHFDKDHPLKVQKIVDQVAQTQLDRYGGIGFASDILAKKTNDTIQDRFGVDNYSKTSQWKIKTKETNEKLYGGVSPYHSEEVKERGNRLIIEHWGGLGFKSAELRKKMLLTYKAKTGYDDWMHDPAIFNKMIASSFRRKKYLLPSGKKIFILGEEPSFLDYVFSNNILQEDEIVYYPKGIKYFTSDGGKHIYFPDFYIPKFHLIVEIKSWYILAKDLNVSLKIQATKDFGYNYIMILDKKYDEFKILTEGLVQKQVN